ncbi:MAG: undecaprenyl diphosphate synthase family protein, partial [Treponemataceae bacterium]|nr:undecaprenyl diphosphate synthase family protein [Treponemataceae bacterium]
MTADELKTRALPGHVAIIMDGNGRWAKQRGMPRTAGHKEGLTAAKRIVAAAASLGIA